MVPDLLALTAELVDIPSESFNEAEFADFVADRLAQSEGLEVSRVGDNVVARTRLARPSRILLGGHLDTVPANGNERARIEGDTLWGLGSADMKGGLAVMIALAEALAEPAVDVTYLFYACEEVASEHKGLVELARPTSLCLASPPRELSKRAAKAPCASWSSWKGRGPTPPGLGWVKMRSIVSSRF